MHRCRSKQIFGGARSICPNFPKLGQKVVVQMLPTVFWCDLQKWSSLIFLQTLGALFEAKQRWAPLLPRFWGCCLDFWGFCPNFQEFCLDFQGFFLNFQWFCPNFQQIKTLRGALAPLHPRLPHHCWDVLNSRRELQFSTPRTHVRSARRSHTNWKWQE